MKFEWIAALLVPRAFAVHPNFSSESTLTAPGKISGFVLCETHFFPDDDRAFRVEDLQWANQLIDAFRSDEGPADFSLNNIARMPDLDFGIRACAAIMSTANGLERNLPEPTLLRRLLDEAAAMPESWTTSVTELWLRLAAAVTSVAYGKSPGSEFTLIRESLDEIGEPHDVHLEINTVVGITAREVLSRIHAALYDAAFRWEMDMAPLEIGNIGRMIRQPTPKVLDFVEWRLSEGYESWTKRAFQEKVRKSVQVFGGSELPGDDSMVTATLVSQFCFHPSSRGAASSLGMSRFLRSAVLSSAATQSWAAQSALNLLRYSGQRENTIAAIRHTVRHGPLSAADGDLQDVLSAIRLRGTATLLELEHLRETAYLLSADDATWVFDRLQSEWIGEIDSPFERWSARWQRREALIRALGVTSIAGSRQTDFCRLVARTLAFSPDEELDRALARSVTGLPISAEHAQPIIAALRKSSGHVALRGVLTQKFPSELISRAGDDNSADDLDEAIQYINEILGGGSRASQSDEERLAEGVLNRLERLRAAKAEASGFSFAPGGPEPLDVAVAFAVSVDASRLWTHITSALTDPHLYREHKSSALRRLATSAKLVPADVRTLLKARIDDILSTPATPLDRHGETFAAAVQLASSLSLKTEDELIMLIGPMSGGQSTDIRRGAVAALAAIPLGSSDPSWRIRSLLALTFDADPDVGADAAQALVHVADKSGQLRTTVMDRTNDLLSTDGTWMVRKILAEISDGTSELVNESLRSRIRSLTNHADWRVRNAASEIAGNFRP